MEAMREIHMSCSKCQGFVMVEIEELVEEKRFGCPQCFTVTIVDTEKLLKGINKINKKVAEARDSTIAGKLAFENHQNG